MIQNDFSCFSISVSILTHLPQYSSLVDLLLGLFVFKENRKWFCSICVHKIKKLFKFSITLNFMNRSVKKWSHILSGVCTKTLERNHLFRIDSWITLHFFWDRKLFSTSLSRNLIYKPFYIIFTLLPLFLRTNPLSLTGDTYSLLTPFNILKMSIDIRMPTSKKRSVFVNYSHLSSIHSSF